MKNLKELNLKEFENQEIYVYELEQKDGISNIEDMYITKTMEEAKKIADELNKKEQDKDYKWRAVKYLVEKDGLLEI